MQTTRPAWPSAALSSLPIFVSLTRASLMSCNARAGSEREICFSRLEQAAWSTCGGFQGLALRLPASRVSLANCEAPTSPPEARQHCLRFCPPLCRQLLEWAETEPDWTRPDGHN